MTDRLEAIRKRLKANGDVLRKRFKVERIGVFGSFVKGEEKEGSDVDMLVEFREPISLIEFVALERYLSELIGRRVDLVTKSALKPRIGSRILKEVRYL
ncbi:MAG: nucleotidyltransferase family protein [Thermoplasmata archaeon]